VRRALVYDRCLLSLQRIGRNMLEARLLGQFEVRMDNKPIAIPSRPAQSLAAFLLLNPGIEHRREKLAGILWPDATEKNALSNLRHALWRLRAAIESKRSRRTTQPHLLTDDISITWNTKSEYWLDASALLRGFAEKTSADEQMQALNQYRGELLPGFYDDWAVLERERLRSVYEQRMTRLLDRLQEEQRWETLIESAEKWIALGLVPEAAFRAMMIAYSRLGDRSKVAGTWQRLVESLRKDLGVEPSEQSRLLYEELKTGGPAMVSAAPTAGKPPAPSAPPNNLPIALTKFIGREREMAEVTQLLETTRLLTLIGPGGIGKTRLALQVGNSVLERFGEGVWLIELAPLTDPALLVPTVAAALGVKENPSRSIEQVLLEHLKQKRVLLILDNCEHMIDACTRLAAAWLRQTSHLKILVTSREALKVNGEIVSPVPALSLPDAAQASEDSVRSEAVRLFVERARFALPSFTVTDAAIDQMAQICRRLDGLALAIELAASRVDMFSLEEINRGTENRFQLLTEGNRAAMPRHQTLRACLDWSWDLFSEGEQVLFRRLAVFAGAWTREDAEQVCTDERLMRDQLLDLLASLVRKSAVAVQTREPVSRYRLLDTIRLYAYERMTQAGEAEQISNQHRDWFLHLVEALDLQAQRNKPTAAWMARLAPEVDNLRAALEWCEKHEGGEGKGLRLSGALGPFWEKQNALKEGREWLGKFLDLSKDSSDALARARSLYASGRLAYLQGDHAHAIAFFGQGLEIEPPDPRLIAQIHSNLGEAFYRLLDYQPAAEHLRRAIELGERIQDPVGVAYAQMQLGNVYHETGDHDRAVASFNGSLQAFREADQQTYIAAALSNLARIHQDRAEYEPAIEGYLEAIQLYENLDNRYGLCIAYDNLSVVYIDLGNYTEAMVYLDRDIQIAETMGNDFRLAAALGNLAECQFYLGELAQAMETISRALSLVKRVQAPHHEGNIYRIRGQIWAARGRKEEAERDFETARELLEPLNHRVRLARLYRAFGKFLLNESSTRAKGIDYMDRAQSLFQALGALKEVERTQMLHLELTETRS
jgi:predicted ATPase/DNA-binding SARP family transcriptional activator/predicted negative regulator of RcsB-dependent stress response